MSTFFANLKTAAFNRETITVGGGQFEAKEVLKELIDLKIALEKANNALEECQHKVDMGHNSG